MARSCVKILSSSTNVKMLGQGVSAKVKAVTYKGMPAAVKSFFGHGDSLIPDIFVLEVGILTKLRHPYVMSLYGAEVNWHKERCQIFMPLGTTDLAQLVKSGEDFDAREMGAQITLGLAYLQNMNIFHGDVKPENIIIMEDLTPKVADFGISVVNACTFDYMTQEANTLQYKTPEMFLASGYDFSAYAWVVGLLLYYMKYGTDLFRERGGVRDFLTEMFHKIGGSQHWSQQQRHSLVLHGVPGTLFFAVRKFLPLTSDPLLNDLLQHTVTTNPENRLSLWQILRHEYFAVAHVPEERTCREQLDVNSTTFPIPDEYYLFVEILDRNQLVPYTDAYCGVFATAVQIYCRFSAKRDDITLRDLVIPCLRLACAVCSESFEMMLADAGEEPQDIEDELYVERHASQSQVDDASFRRKTRIAEGSSNSSVDEIQDEILRALNYDLWFTTAVDYARLTKENLLTVRDSLLEDAHLL